MRTKEQIELEITEKRTKLSELRARPMVTFKDGKPIKDEELFRKTDSEFVIVASELRELYQELNS